MSWTTKPLSRVQNISKHARLFLLHIVIKISNRSRGQQPAGMHLVRPELIVTIPSRFENRTKIFKGSGSPRRKAPARSLLPFLPWKFYRKDSENQRLYYGHIYTISSVVTSIERYSQNIKTVQLLLSHQSRVSPHARSSRAMISMVAHHRIDKRSARSHVTDHQSKKLRRHLTPQKRETHATAYEQHNVPSMTTENYRK